MVESSTEQANLDNLDVAVAGDVFSARDIELEKDSSDSNSSASSDERKKYVVHFGNATLYLKQIMRGEKPPMIVALEELTPEKRKKIEAMAARSKKQKEEQEQEHEKE